MEGAPAGLASVHKETLVSQFWLDEPYRRYGQEAFQRLRRTEKVREALVSACDDFDLSQALDGYRQLTHQAHVFAVEREPEAPEGYALAPTSTADAGFIREHSGDFFEAEEVDEMIALGELFLTRRDSEIVGFGIAVKSRFMSDVVSIGMYTIEAFRGRGVGTATIALLLRRCREDGKRAVAGCNYYNHASKRTLERAGMYSATRLLRVGY
jgi:RimJ/RimL family protein N-acetyltransferase